MDSGHESPTSERLETPAEATCSTRRFQGRPYNLSDLDFMDAEAPLPPAPPPQRARSKVPSFGELFGDSSADEPEEGSGSAPRSSSGPRKRPRHSRALAPSSSEEDESAARQKKRRRVPVAAPADARPASNVRHGPAHVHNAADTGGESSSMESVSDEQHEAPARHSQNEDEDENEERERLNRRRHMAGNMVDSVDDEGNKRRLTHGEQRMRHVMENAPLDEDDEFQLENDHEGLKTVPTKHPRLIALERALGPPSMQRDCFACSRGTKNMASVAFPKLQELQQFILDNNATMTELEWSHAVKEKFDKIIRMPFNQHLRVGQHPIPEWTARSIYDHFMGNHTDEPTIWLVKHMRQLKTISDQLYEQAVFRKPADMVDDARVREKHVRVHNKSVEQFLKVSSQQLRLYAQTPSKMLFYNPVLNFNHTAHLPSILNAHKLNVVPVEQGKRLFNTKPSKGI